MKERFDRWFRPEEHARGEIDEEISSHLAARQAHLVASGLTDEAARQEAVRRFGDVAAAREALLERARARHRRVAWRDRADQMRQDLRFVLRSLARNPVFTIGVVATLALGLGINAAVFRVADQVLFRPPAGVSRPDAIRRVEAMVSLGSGLPQRATIFSYPEATRVIEAAVFEHASTYSQPRILADDQGRELGVSHVDGSYFDLLGVRPSEGRFFDSVETRPGTRPGVAVVSHEHWRRAGSPPIQDGWALRLGTRSYRVVGIAPRGFSGIEANPAQVWLPLGDADFGGGTINGVSFPWYRAEMLRALRIVGRLRQGAEGPARESLTAVFASSAAQMSVARREASLKPIVPVGDDARAESVNAMLIRLGMISAVVLVIAGANAVNLLLARGLRRSREIGIRFAVGASRWRVARLLLAESVVLASAGAAAAAVAGLWTAEVLRRLIFPGSRWVADAFDPRTVLFTFAVGIVAGLVAGVIPAVLSTRQALVTGLKETRSPGARAGRTRALLIVVQTALSVVLLVGCGLLVRSLHRLNAVDLGFQPAGLVQWSAGRSGLTPERVAELRDRIQARPDVRGTALASIAPFGATAMIDITVPGSTFVAESSRDNPLYMAVGPEFFAVMGMRTASGRWLAPTDVAGAEPVAVVNEAMAQRFWGAASPFDSCIIAPPNPCARVVGVVSNVSDTPGGAAPPMRFYLPLAQSASAANAIVVRTRGGAAANLVGELRAMTGTPQPATIEVVSARIDGALHPWWVATLLFTGLGATALILACVGIYSVISYLVAERVHELGVRMALGATAAGVLRLVLRSGFRLIGAGVVAGVVLAASFGHLLNALLYNVSAREPLVYGLAAMALATLATAAMLPAAVRAARINPVEALRSE